MNLFLVSNAFWNLMRLMNLMNLARLEYKLSTTKILGNDEID